jgi:hypothetical protein
MAQPKFKPTQKVFHKTNGFGKILITTHELHDGGPKAFVAWEMQDRSWVKQADLELATSPLREGMVRKGGINPNPMASVPIRPLPPARIR